MAIDDRADRPAYQQIADELRQQIKSGEHGRGSKLPSETELVARYGVTRVTVRRALALLMNEGLTESQRGKGVFVRELPPVLTQRMNRFSRAARRAGKGALAAEAERLGLEWESEELELSVVECWPELAELFGEEQAAVKRRLMRVGGVPTQLADSYMPYSIDQAVGWSRHATAPGGVYGLLEEHGHEITRFREELAARAATPEEAVALALPAAAAVVVLDRIAYDQTARPVEYFTSVAAADKHRYVYEFDAPND